MITSWRPHEESRFMFATRFAVADVWLQSAASSSTGLFKSASATSSAIASSTSTPPLIDGGALSRSASVLNRSSEWCCCVASVCAGGLSGCGCKGSGGTEAGPDADSDSAVSAAELDAVRTNCRLRGGVYVRGGECVCTCACDGFGAHTGFATGTTTGIATGIATGTGTGADGFACRFVRSRSPFTENELIADGISGRIYGG